MLRPERYSWEFFVPAEYWETHYCSSTDVTLVMGEQLMSTKRIEKQIPRAAGWKILLFLAVLIVCLNGVVFYLVFRRSRPEVQSEPVPHYFATIAQAKPLPQTLDPAQFQTAMLQRHTARRRRFRKSWRSNPVIATVIVAEAIEVCWTASQAGMDPNAISA